jgi:hypothetical protein
MDMRMLRSRQLSTTQNPGKPLCDPAASGLVVGAEDFSLLVATTGLAYCTVTWPAFCFPF